ncbi:MAG: cold shock domain-containing protein [Rhodopirellula sp. JB055]|uniref:cold shock domain-containing protein n=1 Tax=Rhodopirellula sp. JB055 TaxID=3342846 RepID=UPI00370CC6F8
MNRPRTNHSDDKEKPFRIQKRRLGRIKVIKPEGEYGFIDSDDFREDVFFHFKAWEAYNGETFDVDSYVEFELDDDQFEEKKRLRAKVFRPTDRPDGKKLSARDATFDLVYHHPKARRRRPSWRDNQS